MEINSKSHQIVVIVKEFLFTQKLNVEICWFIPEFHILWYTGDNLVGVH